MLKPLLLSFSFLTLCFALPAQALQIQQGHNVILTSEWDTGLGFLGRDGSFESGPALGAASSISYDSTTDTVFVINDDVWQTSGPYLYALNPHSHQLTYVGSTHLGADLSRIANHPVTGALYYLNGYGTDFYHMDRQTAALTFIGSANLNRRHYVGISFHPQSHKLYATSAHWIWPGTNLHTINLTTGAATLVTTLDRDVSRIAFDSQGTLHGLVETGGSFVSDLVTIDLATGQSTTICQYPAGVRLHGLDFMPALSTPTLKFDPPSPVGGQSFTIATTGAKADAHTWLAWSLAGPGSTVVPQLGVTLGLASPVGTGAPRISRLDGRFAHTVTLPQLPGLQVWVQSVQADLVSVVQTFTIQ